MANRTDFFPVGDRPGLLRRVATNLVTAFSPAPFVLPQSVAVPAVPEFGETDYAQTVRAALVGRPSGGLWQIAEWLRGNRITICWEKAAPSVVAGLATDRAISHAFVAIDELGAIDDSVEALLKLRRDRPDLVVVLISNTFLHDDVGTHRLPLCDASLRPPIGFFALEFALHEATEVNNPIWVARQKGNCDG